MHFFNFYISCVVLIWAFGKFAWSEDEENREERGLVGANVLGSPRGMQDHAAVKTDVGDTANVRVLPFQQPGRISQNARPVPAGHSAPYAPNNPGPPPTYSNKHPYRGNQVPKYQQSAVNPGYQHQTHLYQPPPHPHYSAHQPYRGPPMAPPHYAQPIPVKQQGYQVPQHAHPQYAQPALVTQRPQYIPQPIHHPTQIQYYKQPPPQTYVNRPAYAPQVLPIYTTRPYVSQPTQHPPYVFQPTNYPPHKIQQAQHQPYATHPGHPLYAPQPPRYVPNATHYPTQHPSLNILPPVIQHRPAYAPQQTQPVPYKIPPNYGPVPIRQPIVYDPSLDPSVTIVPVTISLSTTPTVNKIVTVGTEPTELEPVDTEPTELEPVDTEPTELEPVDTEPNKLKPVEAEPEPEKTKPTELKPVETDATELEPVEVEPTKLEPVEVEPTKLEPVEVEPTELEPVEVEPTEPEPVEVEPTHPESVKAEPNEVKAIESEPIELLGRNPHLPINKETSLPKFPFSIPKSSNQNIPIKPDLDTHNDKHNANLEKTHHNSLINSDRSSSSEISLDSDSSSEHDSSSDSDSSSDEEKENLSYSHHHCNNYPNKLHRKPFYYYRGLNDFFKMLYSNNYNSNYYPYNKNFYKDLKTSNHHNHYKPTQYNPFYSSKYIINPLDNNSEASIYNYNKFYFTNEPKNNNKNGFDLYKILKNVKHLHDCTLNTFSNESAESFETCDNGTNSQSINKTFNESMSEQNCSTLNKNSLHVHSIDDIVLISNKYPTFTSYSLLPDEQVQQNLFIYIPIALLNCDSHIFKTFNAENKKPFPQARPLLLHGQILCPMPIHPPFKLLFHTQEEAVNYRNKPNYYGDYQIPNNIYSKPVNNFQYKVFPGNHFYSTQHKHDTIETNPYDEEQQKIIQEDYIVPPSSNYNPLTNNDDLSRDNYYPPSDNYDSPSDTYNVHADDTDLSRENYESPKNNLVPPSENCDPPSNEYDSSSDNYDPSKDSYNSPSNNYNPIADNNDSSRDNFGTLADNYDSLTNNYSPPRDNYNPINDNNDSFKDNYEPHDGNYDVSNAKYDAPRDNYESPQNPNPEFYHVPILETSNDNSKQDSFELPLEKHTQKTFVDKNPKVIIKPTVTTKLIGQHAKLPNKEQLHTTKEHLPDTKESTYTTQKQKSGHSNYYNNLPSSIKYQAEYDYTKSNSDTSYFSYYDHDKASSGDHNYYFESANTKPDNEYSDYNIDNLPLDDDYKEFSHPPPRYSYPNVPAYYSQYQTDYEDQLNYNDGFANIEYDTYSYDYYANYDEYNEQYSPTKYHYRPNYPEYPKPQLPPQRKLGDYTHSNNRDMFERLSSYVQDKFSDILDSFEDKTYYK